MTINQSITGAKKRLFCKISHKKVNRISLRFSLSFLMLLFGISGASGQSKSEVAHAKSLYNNYHYRKALKAYNHILSKHRQGVEALWRTSLLYSRIGEHIKDEDRKKAYFNKAEKRAHQALKIDKDDSKANFALAVAMGQMARVGDIQDKLHAAHEIKKYAVRALKADSKNAGAWFVLGAWNYKISTMGSIKEGLANLFTHIPSGASMDKAVVYMKKAIKYHPSFILYYVELAKVYKKMDKKKLAIQTCREALQKPNKTPDNKKHKRQCRKLIRQLRGQ